MLRRVTNVPRKGAMSEQRMASLLKCSGSVRKSQVPAGEVEHLFHRVAAEIKWDLEYKALSRMPGR